MARMIEGYTPSTNAKALATSAKTVATGTYGKIDSDKSTTVYGTSGKSTKGYTKEQLEHFSNVASKAGNISALGAAKTVNSSSSASKLDSALTSASTSSYSGGGMGGGSASSGKASGKDPYQAIIDMINETTKANNEWSAQQAQKQMDFQREMSDTAHQREVKDLQAAGLNPVLSAGGTGASTPSGAMGDTDTSNTRLIAEVAMEAMAAVANSASGMAGVAKAVSDDSFFGKLTNFYTTNKLGKKLIDTGLNTISGIARYAGARGLYRMLI